ncbi:hypothetical protein GWO43_07940 [candidate division KSB1 bacterium]|nr:hypothetical protein [candidate division KSB1 bacterium]NIS23900.1 hypothetical protein [candidate division KSB1 bacterium]NIT70817.1 hypothetical protein [candidate division KSB1 bacterium]NIU24549.1 hypothetical protein [candidate division KSB1 bacterium]NIU94503.1 hypothetical protein [candidate division KSB1 bacterium]
MSVNSGWALMDDTPTQKNKNNPTPMFGTNTPFHPILPIFESIKGVQGLVVVSNEDM